VKYELIDNFLSEEEFKVIRDIFMGMEIAWNCIDGVVMPSDGQIQFVHLLYQNYQPQSPYWNQLRPIFTKLDPVAFARAKCNLNMKTPEPVPHSFHSDVDDCITAIYYINTNNGYTEFENGMKFDSVENRILVFNSNEKHRGVTSTDTAKRVLINLNYYI
tara:strand:+ start:1268 stop:1747 length:480 start_codon:yes stop_codon:yes gene_type:complete